MTQILLRGLIALILCTAPAGAQNPQAAGTSTFDFSIRNIMRGPELYGRAPTDIRWSADSRWIYFNWVEPGSAWHETPKRYRVRAVAGAKPERVGIPKFDSVGALVSRGDRSADRRYLAVEYEGDLYVVDMRRGTARRLTQTAARERSPEFAPDARRVFFVRDNNVYSMDLDGGLTRQLTDFRPGPAPTDSARTTGQRGRLQQQQRDLFAAVRDRIRADSIAKAERQQRQALGLTPLYLNRGEQITALSVSPAGTAVLVSTGVDPSDTRQTGVPQFVTESGYTEQLQVRTKVGDVTGKGRIGFLDVPRGKLTWLKVLPSDTAVRSVGFAGWNDSGTAAALYAFSSDNKSRILYSVNARTGQLTTLETLRDTAWVGGPCVTCAGWYDGGRRVWYVSEADGWAHLYTVATDGSGRRQLTSGRWEVKSVELSPDGRHFYLHTSEESPFDVHFYRMPVNGGERIRLTTRSGRHSAAVSPNGEWIADVYSYVNRPPELFLMRNRPRGEMAQLTTSASREWLSHRWIEPEIVMIPASDGAMVPAHIYRPSDVGAQPNGAGVIFVHGAGYLQNVGHFWSEYPREYMFNQYLASRGYVVLDLDYRASAGHGRNWRTAVYRHMGGRDLQDQVDASRYLTRHFGIHPERVGIYGGSYGGFITLMALFTEPGFFGAGAALRSVTDWAHYNQEYTSRILNLPQLDTLAYRRSSPIYFAEGLRDPLLMLHGMVDVNVHYQDIVRLTQRLIELGKKNWELASYPVEDHAFVRPSSWADEYERIFALFERYLPARVPILPDDQQPATTGN